MNISVRHISGSAGKEDIKIQRNENIFTSAFFKSNAISQLVGSLLKYKNV